MTTRGRSITPVALAVAAIAGGATRLDAACNLFPGTEKSFSAASRIWVLDFSERWT